MKKWWESKTVWVGVATVLTAVVTALMQNPDWKVAVLAGIGALNILIRTQTSTSIKRK